MSASDGKRLAIIASTVVAMAIIAGLYVAGSPGDARVYRQDEQRVNQLQSAEMMVREYAREKQKLPVALDSARPSWDIDSTRYLDPATAHSYQYRVVSDSSFELCAEFTRATPAGDRLWDLKWNHPAGHHCVLMHLGK